MARIGTTKYKSNLQEKRVAKDLQAKTVIASGAIWSAKADVRNDMILCECKVTDKPFYSLTMQVWSKVEKEAIKDGLRIPLMCVELNGGKDKFAVFKEKDFRHLYNRYFDLYVGDTQWCDKKSFRVVSPARVIMSLFNDKGETLILNVCTWEDFLYMIKGGIRSGT